MQTDKHDMSVECDANVDKLYHDIIFIQRERDGR